VSKCSEKALKLARQERKMQAKLAKIDSVAAKNIFTRSIDSLSHLKSKLHQKKVLICNNPPVAITVT